MNIINDSKQIIGILGLIVAGLLLILYFAWKASKVKDKFKEGEN